MKQLRVDQATRNPTCGDWTVSNRTKKKPGCSTVVFRGNGEKWRGDFVCVECLRLMIGLILVLLISFSPVVSMVLV